MDQKDLVEDLINAIGIDDSDPSQNLIFIHPRCQLELYNLVDQFKSARPSFVNKLATQLIYLKDLREQTFTSFGNELLSHTKPIADEQYGSIHITSKGYNVRLLVAIFHKRFYLLTAFDEKSGKKRTGYKKYLQIASERMMECMQRDI